MKREMDVVKVSDVFENWLEINHFKNKSLGFKIAENWQEIVGNTIHNHTARIDVKLPKIYLKINNSSLKELLYNDSVLLMDKINKYLEQDVVKEIIFT